MMSDDMMHSAWKGGIEQRIRAEDERRRRANSYFKEAYNEAHKEHPNWDRVRELEKRGYEES